MIYDPQLVRRAMQQDQTAMDALSQQIMKYVLTTCHRYARPGVDPEDAAQDAMIDIMRGLHTLQDPLHFVAWIRLIARRKAIKTGFTAWFRRVRQDPEPDRFAGKGNPEDTAILHEQTSDLHRALDTLSAVERIAVTRTHLQGQTCREVAHEQGWNEATTRRRKQRGEAHLREYLQANRDDAPATLDVPPKTVKS